MRHLSWLIFGFFLMLFTTCKNFEDFGDIDSVNHQPEFAIPLINTSISLNDIIEENIEDLSFLDIAADGSMSINYEHEAVEQPLSEFLEPIPDFPILLVDSTTTIPVNFFDQLSINKLVLKSGNISFDIQSSHTEDISIRIIFPNMQKDGNTFEVSTNLDYNGNTPVMANIPAQILENFELDFTNGEMVIQYEAYNGMGERVLVDAITGMANNWEYEYIEGVWANESFTVEGDTLEVELFEELEDGQVSLEDPKLIIEIENTFGFPVQIQLQNLNAHTSDGNVIPLNTTLSDGFDIDYPNMNERGSTKTSILTIDKNNSNILSVFNARPVFITYDIIAAINPNDNNEEGFIDINSLFSGKALVELPIYGTAAAFTIDETSAFDFGDDLNDINHATFKLITNNRIPAELALQIYFLDQNGNTIDSLFDANRQILQAPEVGANGEVINSVELENLIDISGSKLELIKAASDIRSSVIFSTAENGTVPVRILTSQELDIRMGAIIGVDNGE